MITKYKKNRFVEIIDLQDEIHLLEHHLENVYNFVHKILILTPFPQNENLKTRISNWLDKILIVETKGTEMDVWLKPVTEELNKLDLDFEDVICFSKVSEIPDFENHPTVVEHLKYEPVILRMTDFVFNLSTISNNRHMGSLCFLYSTILKNYKIVSDLEEQKKTIISDKYYTVDNGFKFSFFSDKENIIDNLKTKGLEITREDFEKIIKKNLHPKYFFDGHKVYLSGYNKNVNLNPIFLKNFHFNFESNEKILIIFNLEQRKIQDFQVKDYERILNFNFTKDYSLPEKVNVGSIENINIFIPNKKLYNDKNFETTYSFNEIKKNLRASNIFDEQILDFVIFENEFNLNKKVTFNWSELKEKNLEEIFVFFIN